MKNWEEAKKAYVKDHLSKPLKQPQRRLSALNAIEKIFQDKFPQILRDQNLFKTLSKDTFLKKYQNGKGKPLSSAEKSVINGLYNFSK